MARVRSGRCEVCGSDSRPLYRCNECNSVLCTIGYNDEDLKAAIAKARKGHRKIKVACECCKLGEIRADT